MSAFAQVWVVDFEFRHPDGERPAPLCMAAKNFRTGEVKRLWLAGIHHESPFQPDDLIVAFYSSAEVGCFFELGWEVPRGVLDLYVEFKNLLGGRASYCGCSLLGAAQYFGIKTSTTTESKEENRALAQKEHLTEAEAVQLMDYCEQDVHGTFQLLEAILPKIKSLPQALLRGRYMACVASVERTGIPIDATTFGLLQENWETIKDSLITSVDKDFGLFERGVFKTQNWADYCSKEGIHWPTLDTGRLDMKDGTFRMMADLHPQIQPIRELRATLSQLKLNKLAVGRDHRNRYLLSAFGSLTGRNQPSNQKAIFGPATWIRNLIKPSPGMAVAYIDYEQQEFGIAATLSSDEKMMAAYISGDPYLEFAKQVGLVPKEATKKSHPNERELCKATSLAVLYGMGARALGIKIGQTAAHGRLLLQQHRAAYTAFWKWSDDIEARGMLGIPIETVFGWRTFGRTPVNPRTFRNFPAQANGAEILRVAMIALVESGIGVCAPVHDAVLIEGPLGEIDQTVEVSRAIMETASRTVLSGFTIRTDCKIVRYPDRYSDPRGKEVWVRICEILETLEKQNAQNPGVQVPGN